MAAMFSVCLFLLCVLSFSTTPGMDANITPHASLNIMAGMRDGTMV